jgi:hypothetical protein
VVRVIDADGRVFGRINLVDFAIVGFVVLLVPVAYATYLLFRPPMPRITSVETAQLTMIEDRAAQGTNLAGKLKVRGTGFRPVLRVKVGDIDAVAFVFENPTAADVLVGDLPPGKHDLVMYDGVQEVARAPGAVTIPERASGGLTWVAVAGMLIDLSEAAAGALQQGAKYPASGEHIVEILTLGPVENASIPINNRVDAAIGGRRQRAALIAVRCDMSAAQPRECRSGGALMSPGTTYLLPSTSSGLRLLIDEVVPVADPVTATLRVRLMGIPEAVGLVRAGDVDLPHLAIDRRGAIIRSMGARREGPGDLTLLLSQEAATVLASAARQETISSIDVAMTAGLDRGRAGWRYRGDTIRVGGPFTFSTTAYTLRGIVLGMETGDTSSGRDTSR